MSEGGRSSFVPMVALALGVFAMVALPLSYSWALDPGANPPWFQGMIPVAEFGGLAAALGAFLLGHRARVAGDRSIGAVWGPRLGGAAFLGYALRLILGMSAQG